MLYPPTPITRFALYPAQLALSQIISSIAKRQPRLFARLGEYSSKRFFINPTNLPVALLLEPCPENPKLRVLFKNKEHPPFDVHISGKFMTLLDMANGKSDGDALFFSRDLSIEGDTGAVVALRNALDDMDNSLLEEIALSFGVFGSLIKKLLEIKGKKSSTYE